MKKNIWKYGLAIGLPTLGVGLILFIVISTVTAWYTNIEHIGKIDANTKNVGFSYTINSETLESDDYHISNLAFFDIDSIYEGKYFNDMVFVIELEIKNITDDELNYTVKFESNRMIVGNDSSSYVGCVMTTKKLDYVLTTDEEALAGKTYYTYDTTTHVYEEAENVAEGDDPSGLYEISSNYMQDIFDKTLDATIRAEKIYFKEVNDVFIPFGTRGYSVSHFEEETGYVLYEPSYTKVLDGATYSSTTKYYEKVSSDTGDYFVESSVDATEFSKADVKAKLYTKSDDEDEFARTTDSLIQNEIYYMYDANEEEFILLDKVIPGAATGVPANLNQVNNTIYYEKGSIVQDLFIETPDIKYETNKNTQDPFSVEYTGGHLASKNDTQKLYLYIFGVQEIDTAVNEDFIHNVHDFKIIITGSSETDWTVTDWTDSEENQENQENQDNQNQGA